jgi:hypothetical protein
MKIKKIKFSALRNNEWYQLFAEIKVSIEKFGAEMLGIAQLFVKFKAILINVAVAIDAIRKSPETAQLERVDESRDNALRGFTGTLSGACFHFDETKRSAAERLSDVVAHFGNLAVKPIDEETTGIINLLQELDVRAADVQLLGLNDWVTEIRARNDEYASLVQVRTTEVAGRPKLRTISLRNELQDTFRQMVACVEVLALLNGEATYQPFADELNVIVERYSSKAARHHKRAGEETSTVA